MRDRLITLLAAGGNAGFGLYLLSLAVVGIGVFFMLTPAQHLLQSDRKTARRLHAQEMESSNDVDRAVAAAAFFYRLLGGALIVVGLTILALAWIPASSD
jgi:hypothetical protein